MKEFILNEIYSLLHFIDLKQLDSLSSPFPNKANHWSQSLMIRHADLCKDMGWNRLLLG